MGASLSTLAFGFGSPTYFLSIILGLVLSVVAIMQHGGKIFIIFSFIAYILLLQNIITSLNYTNDTGNQLIQHYMRYPAVLSVIAVAIAARLTDEHSFSRAAMFIAISHTVVLAITIGNPSQLDIQARISTENAAVAALAEIALGTAWAGMLSRKLSVAILAIIVSFAVIFLAQMRTTGIALAISLIFFLWSYFSSRNGSYVKLMLIFSAVGISGFSTFIFWERIYGAFRSILLLDDKNRGIDSGFSGRFDNFESGMANFLENPILGIGFSDPVVNYTHNGYILTAAQFGGPIAIILIFLLISSARRSFINEKSAAFGVIMGLAFFYVGQPRNLNSQLCPLIGIICVSRLYGARRASYQKPDLDKTSPALALRHKNMPEASPTYKMGY